MRYIQFSVKDAKEVVQDDSRLEAFAFALMIKARFVSSSLIDKNTKKKHLKSLFHIGDAKLSRCLKNAEKFGYIRKEGDTIIASKLYTDNENVFRIKLKDDNQLIPIKELERLIRSSVFLNHVKLVSDLNDKQKRQHTGKICKRKSSETNWCEQGKYELRGISYWTISNLMKVSRRSAIRMVKHLNHIGVINKRHMLTTFEDKFVETDCQKELLSKDGNYFKDAIRKNYKFFQNMLREDNIHLRMCDNEFFIQNSNFFSLNDDKLIKFVASNIG